MIRKTNLYDEAKRRLNELQLLSEMLDNKLKNIPSGKLSIKRTEKRIQYYFRENSIEKNGKYISLNNPKLKEYVSNDYDLHIKFLIDKEIDDIQRFLKNSINDEANIKNLYSMYPEKVKGFISAMDMIDEEYINKWKNIQYIGKRIDETNNSYITDKGDCVRSKSELIIANVLYRKAIPYRYECPLKLKSGITIYPDFTVLDVKNRKNVYWEHRGMMDDRDYAKHAVQRIKDYGENGIYLWDNLIITEETTLISLGTREINEIIEKRF